MNFYKTHDPFNSKKVFLFFSRLSTPTSRPMWFKTKARNYLVSYVVQEYSKEEGEAGGGRGSVANRA